MPLLGTHALAAQAMDTAAQAVVARWRQLVVSRGIPMSAGEQATMKQEIRAAEIQALFIHLTVNTVVNGTGGGPAPVVGVIT